MKRLACLMLVAAATLSMTGCAEPKSLLVHRPENTQVDTAVTAMWTHEIETTARDGDWILSRSYYAVSDAIATIAPGEDLSHASIYDAKRGTVIESIGTGVREIPLENLVSRNHYLIVVRPSNMTAAEQTDSVARARTKLGLPFDYAGGIGFDNPDKWYCSELVWWAAQTEARSGVHETIITPANLMQYGEVIYWSGKRDEPQVMELAANREPRTAPAKMTASR
jgi:hypothetical protein